MPIRMPTTRWISRCCGPWLWWVSATDWAGSPDPRELRGGRPGKVPGRPFFLGEGGWTGRPSQAGTAWPSLRPCMVRRAIQARAEPRSSRKPVMVGRSEMANPSITMGGEMSVAWLTTRKER